MVTRYVPDRGHVVWLEFNPQAGREQAGHRPAIVLSPFAYNNPSSLMLCIPLTTQIKGYPFEVACEIDGVAQVALADQVKSLDWRQRKAEKKGSVPQDVLDEIFAKLSTLIKP
jgi:mRNA interferase MazF